MPRYAGGVLNGPLIGQNIVRAETTFVVEILKGLPAPKVADSQKEVRLNIKTITYRWDKALGVWRLAL